MHAGVGHLGKFVVGVAGQHFVGVFQIVLKEGQPIGAFLGQLDRLGDVGLPALADGDRRAPVDRRRVDAHDQERRADRAVAEIDRFDRAARAQYFSRP